MENTNSVITRVRKAHKKSRNGCLTCKIRRVKCDETLPICQRCTRTHWKCVWDRNGKLSQMEISSTGSRDYGRGEIDENNVMGIRASALSIRTFETERESHLFEFFRFHIVTHLSGWFESEFWQRLVVQMSHTEVAVRRAALALGALQVEDDPLNQKPDQPKHALQYYGEALCILRRLLSQTNLGSIDVVLTVCILLACFEILRRDYQAADMHYTSDLEILKMWENRISATEKQSDRSQLQSCIPCCERKLLGHFSILETQVISFIQSRPSWFQDQVLFEPHISGIPIPLEFSTLNEAKKILVSLTNTALNLVNRARARLISEEDDLKRSENRIFSNKETHKAVIQHAAALHLEIKAVEIALTQWMDAFNALLRGRAMMSPQNVRSTAVLKLLHTVLDIMFGHDFSMGEIGYDACTAKFERAVSHGHTAIEFGPVHKRCWSEFSLGPGILQPLYFVAMKCRHRTIRRSAINVLAKTPLQEGLWDGCSASQITKVLIDSEERHRVCGTIGPDGIPREARIIGVKFTLLPKAGRVLLVIDRPDSREEQWVKLESLCN